MINTPVFQLVASLIAMVMIANLQYAWGLFNVPIQEAHPAWTLKEIGVAFSIFINLQVWVQPMQGWLIDRIGPRPFITVAGVLCGAGWSLMGYADSLPALYFYYAMAGIGAAYVYGASIGGALKWFPTRRGAAAGIIAAGFGGGSALFVPMIRYFVANYDYRTAFLVTGIIQGALIAIVAQFLRHPGPDFVPPKPVERKGQSAAKSRRNTENFTTPEMLRTPHFYIMYAMFVAMGVGGLFVTSNSGSLVSSWGMSTTVLATAVALNNVANGVSRIFWGWFSDRIGRENAMVLAFFAQAVCLVSVVRFGRNSPVLFVITLILTYFTWGEIYSLFPSANGDYFGAKNATSNYGFLYSAKGLSAIIGAPIAAAVYEATGSWDAVFYGSAALALLSGVTALVLRTRPLPQKAAA